MRIIVLFLTLSALNVSALEVGDVAPGFTLQASDGHTYQLSDFRDKSSVVIAWFPKAYTRGCTIECKSLAENGHLIRQFNVSYFMASVDPIEDNVGFAEQQNADFPILSDPSKQTAKAYNVLSGRGYALRHTYYIGKDGKIMAIDRSVRPSTSAQDMVGRLASLNVEKSEL